MSNRAEAPPGLYPARLDIRHRLKLPAAFSSFITETYAPESEMYATSLDGLHVVIYPKALWLETKQILHQLEPTSEQVLFNAADMGNDTAIDAQGRIRLSEQLVEECQLTDETLYLRWSRGHIEVFKQRTFDELRENAQA